MKNAEATNTTETAAVAEQGAQVAPEKAASKKAASQKKGAPKANKGAKKAAKQAKAAPKKQAKEKVASKKAAKVKEAKVPREFSKKNIILDLLRRPKGATMAEIAKATDWQASLCRRPDYADLCWQPGLWGGDRCDGVGIISDV